MLFVVPPYLGTDAAWYSYVPLVIVDPSRLLQGRANLSGAGLFDRLARVNDGAHVSIARDLPALAGIATISVYATWEAYHVTLVGRAWAENAALPDGLCPARQRLEDVEPTDAFCAAVEAIVADTAGIADANISKIMALARPSMFPMIDSVLQHALRGKNARSDADWQDRGCFSFWMSRFRRLLIATGAQLSAIEAPTGLPYSSAEKLDRLLWLGHYGAGRWLGADWTTVTDLPRTGLLMPVWQIQGATSRDARVVLPATLHGTPAGDCSFPALNGEQRAAITAILQEANEVGSQAWGTA